MRRPSGLTDADMPPIERRLKSIYGLPMASAKLREHSDTTLKIWDLYQHCQIHVFMSSSILMESELRYLHMLMIQRLPHRI